MERRWTVEQHVGLSRIIPGQAVSDQIIIIITEVSSVQTRKGKNLEKLDSLGPLIALWYSEFHLYIRSTISQHLKRTLQSGCKASLQRVRNSSSNLREPQDDISSGRSD